MPLLRQYAICYATALTLLLLEGASGRIIGHPYHTPPWSNEANLEANIKKMLARREKERKRFDVVYADELGRNHAITVTESPEETELKLPGPDTQDIENCIARRPYLAKMYDYMDESNQVRKQRLEKNISNVPIENFYDPPAHDFPNTFSFTTTSKPISTSTTPASTLVYTFRFGFVFEEIVGLISTTPTPPRHPKPRSTEIYPWELWPENTTFQSDEIKRMWQINRFTPFLVHFTNSDYQELTTTPIGFAFNMSWEYSDDPCDLRLPPEFRNQTTLPTTYDSHYIM